MEESTGSLSNSNDLKTIIYPFDKYEIEIAISLSHEFIGIKSVKINKDFLSSKQRRGTVGYLDVEKYYED